MKKTMKNVISSAVALVMTLSLLFGVMPPSQVIATTATSTTVTLEVLPGDGYISLLERYADILPVEWTEEDLQKACGYRVLVPGPMQVNVSSTGTSGSTTVTTPTTSTSPTTVNVQVRPGDGYWAVFTRNRSVFPASWSWKDLEKACGGKVLIPGPLQVNISSTGTSGSTTVTTQTNPTTVNVQVLPGDGYWAVFVRNRSKFPSNWGWKDLEAACGGRVLIPGPMQVNVSSTGTSGSTTVTTQTNPTTVNVQVLPGDGYWSVFVRNRSKFPASWDWTTLQSACGGRVLVPGPLQVSIGGSTSSRRPAPGTILGTITKANWCDENSNHNIKTAAAVLDGQVIKAGEEFGWWKNVGSCTSWPYVEAGTTNGTAIGGGICYPSTLLYQAAVLRAGLKELERHNHYPDRAIWYAEFGEDAAISWGTKNMRFLNDSGVDVRIDAKYNEQTRELTISIVAL